MLVRHRGTRDEQNDSAIYFKIRRCGLHSFVSIRFIQSNFFFTKMLCEAVLVVGILLPKCYHHNASTLTVAMPLLRWYLAGAADILSWTWITSKFTAIHLTVVKIFHSEAPPHTKSQEFILWGPWMSAPNSTATKQTRISRSHFHAGLSLPVAGRIITDQIPYRNSFINTPKYGNERFKNRVHDGEIWLICC